MSHSRTHPLASSGNNHAGFKSKWRAAIHYRKRSSPSPQCAGRSFANPWQWACQRFLSLPVLQRRISHPLQPLRRKFPSKTTRLPAWAFPGAENSTLAGAQEKKQRLSLWCTRRHLGLFCSQAYSRTPTEYFLFFEILKRRALVVLKVCFGLQILVCCEFLFAYCFLLPCP